MNLHQNQEMFQDAIRATAEALNYTENSIHQNYWMTVLLYRLACSAYARHIAIQEETSVPNDYALEYSSDNIDLVIHAANNTTAQARQLVVDIVHEIKQYLQEFPGTYEAKSEDCLLFQFENSGPYQATSMEVNIKAISNTFPSWQLPVKTYIGQFLAQKNLLDLIKQYQLLPFEVTVSTLKKPL